MGKFNPVGWRHCLSTTGRNHLFRKKVKITMENKVIELNENEFLSTLNILNEVCHGINVSNFEKSIGEKKEVVVAFMDKISNEEGKDNIILNLNNSELSVLKNSINEVFKQIDEWEFETRIGISIQEMKTILEKL